MKNNIVTVMAVLFAVVVLTITFGATAQAAGDVVVGFLLPLTGSSSDIGEQIKLGASIAASEINDKGGVPSLGGARLRLVFADSNTHPVKGVKETERLIKNDNVSVLCGAYNSFVTLPATEVAEKYGTPWVVNSSVMDKITERGFKYVFRPCNTTFDDAREQLDAVELFSEETGRRPVTAGLLYEGTDWGRSHARNIRKLAKERGFYLVMDEGYLPDRGDFSPQLSLIRQRKPEFLIVALYTDEHILFSKQYMKSKIDIPFGIHSVGAGSEDPVFYKSVPQAAVAHMFVQEDWPLDQIYRPGRVATLNKMFNENLGYGLDAYGAQGYSNVWVIYDAVNRSGSTNREKIRDALAKTNITSGPALITGYQRITFNEKGQNANAHGVVSQNQNGRRITLWPKANRPSGAAPKWPIPAWSQR